MNKAIGILLCLLGGIGMVFGIVMTVMAVQYQEWRRVLFYGIIALFSAEILIFGLLKFKKKP